MQAIAGVELNDRFIRLVDSILTDKRKLILTAILPLWKKPKHIATNFGETIRSPMRLTSAECTGTTRQRTGL